MGDDLYLQPVSVAGVAEWFPTEWLFAEQLQSATPADIDASSIKGPVTSEAIVDCELARGLANWPPAHVFTRALNTASVRKRDRSRASARDSRTTEQCAADAVAINGLVARMPSFARLRQTVLDKFATARFLDSLGRGRAEWRGAERNLVQPESSLCLPSSAHMAATASPGLPSDHLAADRVPPRHPLLRVSVYHQTKKAKVQQEFVVLGGQSLADLRDRIYCLSDFVAGDGEPASSSSFFYFEGVFYEDSRTCTAPLSKHVADWINSPDHPPEGSGWGSAEVGSMQRTRFGDLSLRVGAHYLYCHQRTCEHIIVVSDIRLFNPVFDNPSKSAYPVHCFQRRVDRRPCTVCNTFTADFVTYDDVLADTHPAHFCMHCYQPLHYNPQGQLVREDFSVAPYFHG